MAYFLISFRSLLNCHFLMEAITDQQLKSQTYPSQPSDSPSPMPAFLFSITPLPSDMAEIVSVCLFIWILPTTCRDYCLFYSWPYTQNLEEYLPDHRFLINIGWINEIFKSLGLFCDFFFQYCKFYLNLLPKKVPENISSKTNTKALREAELENLTQVQQG